MINVSIKKIEEEIKILDNKTALEKLYEIKEYSCTSSLEKLILKYENKNKRFQKEIERFNNMSRFEEEGYRKGYRYIAGIDEAGRGPLAGPVVASCVILPRGIFIEKLNDSKKLSASQRERIYDEIMEKAIAVNTSIITENTIDDINILNATRKAMTESVNFLDKQPDLLLIDSEKLNHVKIDKISIIKGDTLSISVAAASIIAKVTRDRLLVQYDKMYPEYGFEKHKGYGTKEHIDAIKEYGLCPIHRKTFTKKFV